MQHTPTLYMSNTAWASAAHMRPDVDAFCQSTEIAKPGYITVQMSLWLHQSAHQDPYFLEHITNVSSFAASSSVFRLLHHEIQPQAGFQVGTKQKDEVVKPSHLSESESVIVVQNAAALGLQLGFRLPQGWIGSLHVSGGK